MKSIFAILAACLALTAHGGETTGQKIKSDAKAMAHGVKDAAVDVGKQIGHGSKKAYKSTKSKIKKDVDSGAPGDGSLAAKNEKLQNAKDGRE